MDILWNAADQSGCTISDSGHRATANSFNYNGARGAPFVDGALGGKFYCEFPANSLVDSRGFIGFSNASASNGNGNGSFLSLQADGAFFGQPGGNSGLLSNLGVVTNHHVSFAIDFVLAKAWVRFDGGDWNNNSASDLVTGFGGAAFAGAPVFAPHCTIIDSGGYLDINAGDRDFVYAAPAGYLALDGTMHGGGGGGGRNDYVSRARLRGRGR